MYCLFWDGQKERYQMNAVAQVAEVWDPGKDWKERVNKEEEWNICLPNFYLYIKVAELCDYLNVEA